VDISLTPQPSPGTVVPERYAGKVVVVAGGSAGIGRACVERFHAEAARVVVVGRDIKRAEETVESLPGQPPALAVSADIGKPEDCARIAHEAEARFGRVDVLINCAATRSVETDDVLALSQADWHRTMAINVNGPLWLSREVLPGMLSRGRGAIVNLISSASFEGGNGAGYTTSKHASSASLVTWR
jgi:NAD(P)-dependent dehydrogenase (short-subunit alcohol dehydrogenase family)